MKISLNYEQLTIQRNVLGEIKHVHQRMNINIFMFRGIMDVLGLMKLDMANFNIRQYRPILQQQAVAYEKLTFEKFMENQRGLIVY